MKTDWEAVGLILAAFATFGLVLLWFLGLRRFNQALRQHWRDEEIERELHQMIHDDARGTDQ